MFQIYEEFAFAFSVEEEITGTHFYNYEFGVYYSNIFIKMIVASVQDACQNFFWV